MLKGFREKEYNHQKMLEHIERVRKRIAERKKREQQHKSSNIHEENDKWQWID